MALPANVGVTILADRGCGDTNLYALLTNLGFGFVILFKVNILVTDANGVTKPAGEWVPRSGRATKLVNAQVTGDKVPIPMVVVTKAAGMKDSWCLACSDPQMSASIAVST